jgi:hypothetical protein
MNRGNINRRASLRGAQLTNILAKGAIAGPIAFTLAWLVLGVVSPGYTLFGTEIAPYSSISQPISGLGLGPTAPYMNTAFVLCGLALLAGIAGSLHAVRELSVRARLGCALLLALTPIGMIIDGVFTLEAMIPHLLGFLFALGAPVISFFLVGWKFRQTPGWKTFGVCLQAGSLATLILFVLFFAVFDPVSSGANSGYAGLVQRILAIEVLGFFAAFGWLCGATRPARV